MIYLVDLISSEISRDFLQIIGVRSKSKNHHATMTIVSFSQMSFAAWLRTMLTLPFQKTGSVYVHWTTHNPRGLSAKDTFMAQYCDEQARLVGAVEESQGQKCTPAQTSQM